MKKTIFTLIALFALAVQSQAMHYEQARNEALFLTDKMAYELNLSDAQYEAAFEINLDYLMGVTSRYDVFGPYWERRNADLQFILYSWQWEAFRAAAYFFRPLRWDAGAWHFGIYARYPHRDYFYFGRPHSYVSYRGGHSWHMNGGHSYYGQHRYHFRPDTHHNQHTGMRDGWNRGDFHGTHSHSSTHVTGPGGRDQSNRHHGTGHSGTIERNGGNSHSGTIERNGGNSHSGSIARNGGNSHSGSIARNGGGTHNGSMRNGGTAGGGGRSSSRPEMGGRR